jgi:hypothetical protein
MQNRISLELTNEWEQNVIDKIAEIITLLPKGIVTLSAAETESLPKMGDKSLAFVEKAIDAAHENRAVCPVFIDVEEMSRDLDTYQRLNRIKRQLMQLLDPINDSAMLAGSEVYTAALAIYHTSADAARLGVPGAKSINAALATRFPGRSKNAKKEEQ